MLDSLPDELQAAWRKVGEDYAWSSRLRLAVSGGPDSLAMLIGFAALRDAKACPEILEVVTVDHGLRLESADETRMVAEVCNELDVDCRIETLRPPEDLKNKQAWARFARYKALVDEYERDDPPILTAHTADDQAETFLMRAARGTGSEGLAGIRSPVKIGSGRFYRPFLNWRRHDLHAILNDAPWPPVHDPSNDDESYTRIRFRRWLADAPTPDSARSLVHGYSETARIAQLESAALEHYAEELVTAIGGADRGFVHGHQTFLNVPRAVQARFLRKILVLVARPDNAQVNSFNGSFDLARMVKLADQMANEPKGRWVGGGAVLDWHHDGLDDARHTQITAFAEAGRTKFPKIEVAAGETATWDGRFEVANTSSQTIIVRAWTSTDPLPPHGEEMPSKAALASLPIAVQGDAIVAWAGPPPRQSPHRFDRPTLQAVRRQLLS